MYRFGKLCLLFFIFTISMSFSWARRTITSPKTLAEEMELVERTSAEWKTAKDPQEEALDIFIEMQEMLDQAKGDLKKQDEILKKYLKIEQLENKFYKEQKISITAPVTIKPATVEEPITVEEKEAVIKEALELEEKEEFEELAKELEEEVEEFEPTAPLLAVEEPPLEEEVPPKEIVYPTVPTTVAPITGQPATYGGMQTGGMMMGGGMMGMQQMMGQQPAIGKQRSTTKSRAASVKFIKDLDQSKRSGNALSVITGLINLVKTVKTPLPNVEMLANYEKGIKAMMLPGMGMSREIKGVERREPLDEFRRTMMALPHFIKSPKGQFYEFVEKGEAAGGLGELHAEMPIGTQTNYEYGNLLALTMKKKRLRKIFTGLTLWHLSEGAFIHKEIDIRPDLKFVKKDRNLKTALRGFAKRKLLGPTKAHKLRYIIEKLIIMAEKIDSTTVTAKPKRDIRSYVNVINTVNKNIMAYSDPKWFVIGKAARKKQAVELNEMFRKLLQQIGQNKLIQDLAIDTFKIRWILRPLEFFTRTGVHFTTEVNVIKKADHKKPKDAAKRLNDALNLIASIKGVAIPTAAKSKKK